MLERFDPLVQRKHHRVRIQTHLPSNQVSPPDWFDPFRLIPKRRLRTSGMTPMTPEDIAIMHGKYSDVI